MSTRGEEPDFVLVSCAGRAARVGMSELDVERMVRAKRSGEDHLRMSGLGYTVVRPGACEGMPIQGLFYLAHLVVAWHNCGLGYTVDQTCLACLVGSIFPGNGCAFCTSVPAAGLLGALGVPL
eukprot:scaffold230172_cov27-Tisochrysis_lutea.AAC.3